MKTTLDELFGTNETLETEGRWFKFGKGVEFKIARMNNIHYKRHVEKAIEPYRQEVINASIDKQVQEDIIRGAMAKTILVDWKGIVDSEGKEVKYTVKKAEEFLAKFKDLREKISELSSNMANYRESIVEESEKN